MPDKLPNGWAKTKFRDVVRHHSGDSSLIKGRLHDSPGKGRIPAFSASGQDVWADIPTGEGDAVIVSAVGARCGKAFLASGKWAAIANTHVVWPEPVAVDPKFLWYRINDEQFWERGGTAQPFVLVRKTFEHDWNLPPLAEQERIVAKLDLLLSRLAAGEAATRRALVRLKRYRASVLEAAVSGELSRDWRQIHKSGETGGQVLRRLLRERRARWEEAELKRLHAAGKLPKDDKWKKRYVEPTGLETAELPSLPRGWAWASLQQLGFIVGGLTKNPRRARLRLKVPYLRVANVYANELRLDEVKTIGVDKTELDKLLLQKGDLLIVEGNGSKDQIGRLAIWDGSIEKCVHQNHIIKVRLVENALGAWILSWLLSPPGRHHVEKVASSTTGLYTLSVSKVGNLPIPLPRFDEQAQIVRGIERRLIAADRLSATLNRNLVRTRATRQSLLRDAFAGKLVPQHPTEESASILLNRIRADREAEAKKPKPKRMPKSKALTTRRSLLEVLRMHKKPIPPEQLFREAGFHPSEADLFYRELTTLRKLIYEKKPSRIEARAWPNRARVLLKLKEK